MQSRRSKICIVTTVGLSLDVLFPDFYPMLQEQGYDVVGICTDDPYVENVRRQGVRVITVPMTREFTPLRDLMSLWKLYNIFKKEKFDLIHYGTPKAGLLAAIAGRLAGCPALLFTLRGLGYYAFSGIKRKIGRFCDKITSRFAHYIIVIAPSLKEEALKEKLAAADKMHVLGKGSSKGVNLQQFQLDDKTLAKVRGIREGLSIEPENIVIGYAGRLTQDKKLAELLEAFCNIHAENNRVHMLWIGDQDERNPLPDEVNRQIENHPAIHVLPFQDKHEIASYMAALDIFVLPSASFREGFGNVVIEASAMERPVIATKLAGSSNAVLDGVTGILVDSPHAMFLEKALKELIKDSSKRAKMGQAGRKWVKEDFDRSIVWKRTIDVYTMLLG